MEVSIRHRYIKKIPVLEVVLANQKNLALPLIVYYHGWQSRKELSLTQARKLAKKGFRVVLPDAMNHGERKIGPISTIPAMTFWSSIQFNLIEFSLIIRYFQKRQLIDNQWIGVGGVSMGGITTCALLTHHPEIKVAVCMMGTPAPQAYLQQVIDRAKAMNVYVPGDLSSILSWITTYDLSQNPAKIAKRPLLFWHGTEDQKIPYEEVAAFYNRIQTKNYAENCQLITGQEEKHLVKGVMMETVADFFAAHLIHPLAN